MKSSMRQRLENVWEHLEMPHGLKMQFAARYSEPRRAESMNDILPIWEKAARCITMRERLLIVLYNLRQKVGGAALFVLEGFLCWVLMVGVYFFVLVLLFSYFLVFSFSDVQRWHNASMCTTVMSLRTMRLPS